MGQSAPRRTRTRPAYAHPSCITRTLRGGKARTLGRGGRPREGRAGIERAEERAGRDRDDLGRAAPDPRPSRLAWAPAPRRGVSADPEPPPASRAGVDSLVILHARRGRDVGTPRPWQLDLLFFSTPFELYSSLQ